jgi:hypothetical protein
MPVGFAGNNSNGSHQHMDEHHSGAAIKDPQIW